MNESGSSSTHLFVIRVWAQDIENGRSEWRGRVQHIPSGEVHFFREWADMVSIVQQLLPDDGGDEGLIGDR